MPDLARLGNDFSQSEQHCKIESQLVLLMKKFTTNSNHALLRFYDSSTSLSMRI
jgi:hypothetical protein